ncbi:O-methyltransferase family protein [Cordyceps javanica]|uniref:O-methyltransferase family protein n=1 Tax=Cordyceps javanica TaxID=43265 RepID=A0A545V6E1_9HYPO|nr:O-methyltransferase family protein [Cordyceps javanica]TQW08523.1 O-methyltransferase family protein [Cordyceps javanica]
MGSDESISSLAAQVSSLAGSFTKSLADVNIAEPNFSSQSPTSYDGLTAELFLQRQGLLDKIMDMWYLFQGPSERIFNYVHTCMPDIMALNLMNHFDLWSAVPLNDSASVGDIAKHVDLPEEVVKPLVQSTGLRALVSTVLDDAGAPMLAMNKALELHARGQPKLSKDMTRTSFALHQRGATIGNYTTSWEYIENDGDGERKGWRQRNFVEFMRYIKEIFKLEATLETSFDWEALGKSTVVDVGGSGGHDSFYLAEKFPELKIIVEDLPEVEPAFNKHRPEALKDRVTFVAHDFFEPQTVQADVFLLKLILHDWPDEECVKILRGFIPALRPGARVFLLDYVGRQDSEDGQPPMPRSIQQMGTATDLRMMALFSAEERPAEAWKTIIRSADDRFDIKKLDDLSELFIKDCWWRDILSFSWDCTTKRYQDNFGSFLNSSSKTVRNLKVCELGGLKPVLVQWAGQAWVQTAFTFDAEHGDCRGLVRLENEADMNLKSWKVFTELQELHPQKHLEARRVQSPAAAQKSP